MASIERRLQALEDLYGTPAAQEERYSLKEEKRAAIRLRLHRVIEEERKGMPPPSEEEVAQGVEELERVLRERAGYGA